MTIDDACGIDAAELIHGAVHLVPAANGRVRPMRFMPSQMRALGSCAAWYPGMFVRMATCTSGVTLDFVTDANMVCLDVAFDDEPRDTREVLDELLTPGVYDGISLDIYDGDGEPVRHVEPTMTLADDGLLWFEVAPSSHAHTLPGLGDTRRVRMWLPALRGCEVGRLTCDGTVLKPWEPVSDTDGAQTTSSDDMPPYLLVLGDSIAQGFVAADPAHTWPARLAGLLNLDLLNQGVGGQVFQESSLNGLDQLDAPQLIVVAYGANYRYQRCGSQAVRRDIRAFLNRLAHMWPQVPRLVLTPTYTAEDVRAMPKPSAYDHIREILASEVVRQVAAGQPVKLVDGRALLDADFSLVSDGRDHPGDHGAAQIAQRLNHVVRTCGLSIPSVVSDPVEEPPVLKRTTAPTVTDVAAERLLGAAFDAGDLHVLPLLEVVRRGVGQAVRADDDVVLVRLGDGGQMLWAPNVLAGTDAVHDLCERTFMSLSTTKLTPVVKRDLGFTVIEPYHVGIYLSHHPLPCPSASDGGLDIRVLGPEFAPLVYEHYSHPEYFPLDEVTSRCEASKILGGFDASGNIVGYIGEHYEGSMGMLEVFPEYRRRGYARLLESAKINEHLSHGFVPWSQIYPDNDASIALQRSLGVTLTSADEQCFMFPPA